MNIRPLIDSPIDGLVPDFSIFGAQFTQLWQKAFVAAWAIAIIISIFFLLKNLTAMANADEDNPGKHKKARSATITSLIVLGGLVAFAVIVGVVLAIVSI